MIYGHFTMYFKTVVMNNAMITIDRDIYCTRAVGGSGRASWDPNNPTHTAAYKNHQLSTASCFWTFAPQDRADCHWWQSLTGALPASMPGDNNVADRLKWPGASGFAAHWNYSTGGSDHSVNMPFKWRTDRNDRKHNVICVQDFQMKYDPMEKRYSDVVINAVFTHHAHAGSPSSDREVFLLTLCVFLFLHRAIGDPTRATLERRSCCAPVRRPLRSRTTCRPSSKKSSRSTKHIPPPLSLANPFLLSPFSPTHSQTIPLLSNHHPRERPFEHVLDPIHLGDQTKQKMQASKFRAPPPAASYSPPPSPLSSAASSSSLSAGFTRLSLASVDPHLSVTVQIDGANATEARANANEWAKAAAPGSSKGAAGSARFAAPPTRASLDDRIKTIRAQLDTGGKYQSPVLLDTKKQLQHDMRTLSTWGPSEYKQAHVRHQNAITLLKREGDTDPATARECRILLKQILQAQEKVLQGVVDANRR